MVDINNYDFKSFTDKKCIGEELLSIFTLIST